MRISGFWFSTLLLAVSGLMMFGAAAYPEGRNMVTWKIDQKQETPAIAPTALPISLGEHPVFVLDVLNGRVLTELHVIDGDTRRIVSTLSLRYTPEIAFSTHIEHMYVLDTYFSRGTRGDASSVLSVIDPNTLEILADDIPVPDRLLYKVFPVGDRWFFVSPDGLYLFVGKYGAPDIHQLRLTVLNARTYEQVAEYPFPVCDDNRVQVMRDGSLLCVRGKEVVAIAPLTGKETLLFSIGAETTHFTMMGRATRVAGTGQEWFHFDDEGRVTVVEMGVTPPRVVVEGVPLRLPEKRGLGGETLTVIGDDGRLYVGLVATTGPLSGSGLADAIRVYDTETWELLGELKPPEPIGYMAVSNDGTQLYVTSPQARLFAVYDTKTLRRSGLVKDLGVTPAAIFVPKAVSK